MVICSGNFNTVDMDIQVKQYNPILKEWEIKDAKLLEVGDNEGARIVVDGIERWTMISNLQMTNEEIQAFRDSPENDHVAYTEMQVLTEKQLINKFNPEFFENHINNDVTFSIIFEHLKRGGCPYNIIQGLCIDAKEKAEMVNKWLENHPPQFILKVDEDNQLDINKAKP